ncbi:hypothetical protein KCP75_04315 [Salmonella enterica subsp. enterica]|nr:hypothetical protein KCP75_04315 [Salmonella enterica subsp. enterica]
MENRDAVITRRRSGCAERPRAGYYSPWLWSESTVKTTDGPAAYRKKTPQNHAASLRFASRSKHEGSERKP